MPGYIDKVLQQFKCTGLEQAAVDVPPVYGTRVQYVIASSSDAPPLAAAKVTEVRGIVGSLLVRTTRQYFPPSPPMLLSKKRCPARSFPRLIGFSPTALCTLTTISSFALMI